jgi:hypothetical protein
MSGRRHRKAEHTEEWERLLPLFEWPEQERYETIRPLVLFGDSLAERAQEVGASEWVPPKGLFTAGWTASRPKGWRASSTPRPQNAASSRPP